MEWGEERVLDCIRDCFVTGKWKDSEDAEELLKMDDDEDEDAYGDFEDLETGEVHKAEDEPGKSDSEQEEDNPRVVEDEREVKRRKLEKKRALKARFDAGKMNDLSEKLRYL